MGVTGKLYSLPSSKSCGSWAGVTFIMPVPNLGSTSGSAMT
ncbi:MAG: hypothetical protein ACD_57C00252G0001, partial [uncultured bacterium]